MCSLINLPQLNNNSSLIIPSHKWLLKSVTNKHHLLTGNPHTTVHNISKERCQIFGKLPAVASLVCHWTKALLGFSWLFCPLASSHGALHPLGFIYHSNSSSPGSAGHRPASNFPNNYCPFPASFLPGVGAGQAQPYPTNQPSSGMVHQALCGYQPQAELNSASRTALREK